MRRSTSFWLAWGSFVIDIALLVWSFVLATGAASGEKDFIVIYGGIGLVLGYGGVGALMASRRPGNAIGWLFCATATVFALSAFADEFVTRGLVTGSMAFVIPIAWLQSWLFVLALESIPLVLVLFPDGRPPSRRWRPLVWAIASLTVLAVLGFVLSPNELETPERFHLENPTAIEPLEPLADVFLTVGGIGSLVAALAALTALVLRFRRSSGDERQQIRWLAYVGIAALVLMVGTFATESNVVVNNVLFFLLFIVLAIGVPAAIGTAILKYGLYEIDLVIRRTIVYAALAAFVTVVYVSIVVGVGAAVGSRGNTILSAAAAAVVALAFQPARRRAQHLANRLVFGKRATPYEVLSTFSDRLADAYSVDDVLPRIARVLAEGTGAEEVTVWLRVDDRFRAAGSWPSDAPTTATDVDRLPDPSFEVRHLGEALGAISVTMPANERITAAQEKLAAEVAAQAGLVLRNVRLVEELRESRRRIVAAQDDRAKKLERNIHDGAQQQLVALRVKARLARQLAARDTAKTEEMLAQIEEDTQHALEDLRDLARGIYPPLLADKGLPAALAAQARKVPIPTQVAADGIGRFEPEVEATIYFCTLEALQNATKYAQASTVDVSLRQDDGVVEFTVADDGRGFDPGVTNLGTGLQGMVDRVEAIGGTIEIESATGAGTTVRGRIPATEMTR
ncbi:MAG: histidine kinase [Actinomycetia bacterium]|nr:histidine kinase [Actinomycetes bacterium]